LRVQGLRRHGLRRHGLRGHGLRRHGLLPHRLGVQGLLEVADGRRLLLHLPGGGSTLAWTRERWGSLGHGRSGAILEAGDIGNLRRRRGEEVMRILAGLVLLVLMLVGVRWVRRRVLWK
jgi:hypothetical protein